LRFYYEQKYVNIAFYMVNIAFFAENITYHK
jgi:hypothetical protein